MRLAALLLAQRQLLSARLHRSGVVIRGGVEPPTFRFSGVAYAKLTPHHASAAGCRRSFLLAVGCRCCCHRCCQPSPGGWHARGADDAVLRRSSQDLVLAKYAEVGAKSGHVTVTRIKRYAMYYELGIALSPARRGIHRQVPYSAPWSPASSAVPSRPRATGCPTRVSGLDRRDFLHHRRRTGRRVDPVKIRDHMGSDVPLVLGLRVLHQVG